MLRCRSGELINRTDYKVIITVSTCLRKTKQNNKKGRMEERHPGGIPIVDYTERLRTKGVPFADCRYMQGCRNFTILSNLRNPGDFARWVLPIVNYTRGSARKGYLLQAVGICKGTGISWSWVTLATRGTSPRGVLPIESYTTGSARKGYLLQAVGICKDIGIPRSWVNLETRGTSPGGILTIVNYTKRLHPKGVPFADCRYARVGISQSWCNLRNPGNFAQGGTLYSELFGKALPERGTFCRL